MEAMGIALGWKWNDSSTYKRGEKSYIEKQLEGFVKLALDKTNSEKFRLKNILNEKAVRNAFAVDMAMGGSSNTVLHMLAIAKEAGVRF